MDNQNNNEKEYLHVLGRELIDLIQLNPTWKIDASGKER